jgi:hypothetical protein
VATLTGADLAAAKSVFHIALLSFVARIPGILRFNLDQGGKAESGVVLRL